MIVDFDGDLDADLFIGNGGMNQIPDKEEPNRLFMSAKSQTQHAVSVTLEGVQSNRDGVGAMIAVQGADPGQPAVTRWVVRSSGFNSSVPKEQVIGLGDRPAPYVIEIRWPSGVTQLVDVADSGQRVAVVEPSD